MAETSRDIRERCHRPGSRSSICILETRLRGGVWLEVRCGTQVAGPIWIILIQRAVIVKKPRLCVIRCLVIRGVNDRDYERVGRVQVRYGSEKDNPSISNSQAGTEEIHLV
jgi:hypothetical protein